MSDARTDESADRTSSGEFSLESVLAVFDDRSDPGRPLTANDVMEALGCSRRTAHNKLNALVEQGRLATRKVGARGRVWWVPLDSVVDDAAQARAERELAIDSEVHAVDLPGDGERLAKQRAALQAAYDFLGENPEATESEVITEVFPDHPAGYDTADDWWAVIKPALKELPAVDVAADTDHFWHYVGG